MDTTLAFAVAMAANAVTVLGGLGAVAYALMKLKPETEALQASAASSKMSATHDEFQIMEKAQNELRTQVAELKSVVSDTRLEQLENKVAYRESLEAMEARAKKAEQSNKDLAAKVDLLRKELETERESHAKQIATLEAKLTTMATELETERKARQKLARELETANKENAELRKRVQTLESKEVTSDKK